MFIQRGLESSLLPGPLSHYQLNIVESNFAARSEQGTNRGKTGIYNRLEDGAIFSPWNIFGKSPLFHLIPKNSFAYHSQLTSLHFPKEKKNNLRVSMKTYHSSSHLLSFNKKQNASFASPPLEPLEKRQIGEKSPPESYPPSKAQAPNQKLRVKNILESSKEKKQKEEKKTS